MCSDARARAVLLGRREGAGSTKELAPTTSEKVFSTSEVNPTISDVNPFLLRRASKRLSLSATQPLDFDFNSRPSVKVVLKSRRGG